MILTTAQPNPSHGTSYWRARAELATLTMWTASVTGILPGTGLSTP
jgi:hypothetical protein